jgi:hypothetical protein
LSRPSPALALLVSLAFTCGACNDNVTCVFTTGCVGGGGAISDNEAVLPIDGEWIVDGPPEIDAVFPSSAQNAGSTPIVLLFSETMQADSLQRAIEIVADGTSQPVAGVTQALVSDGRVLVLLPSPADALDPGHYVVRLADDALPLDLTGQELAADPQAELGEFTVVTSPASTPRLVATFPRDGADDQSETTEIVAVFDRPVLPQSVDARSFDVRVNGNNPIFDPPAAALTSGAGTADTRVFLYRSLGLDGRPAPLGTGAQVQLRLSPAGDPIEEADGGILPAATIDFETLAFSPPISASLTSVPSDAIGLANLTKGNARELEVEVKVDRDTTLANDSVDLVLFGVEKSSEPDAPRIALQQSVRLSGPTPIDTATFLREDVPLQFSDDPEDTRLEDGSVTFAFRARRGSVVTPVRLLDLDPDPDTIQDPLLDTAAPEVVELVGSTGTSSFRSDQRGLSLAGTADEELRAVDLTPRDANEAPPVVGSTPSGSMGEHVFLAAPVDFGVLASGSAMYEAVAFDVALNPSAMVSGTFTQLGTVGPDPYDPGDPILVEVFDSRTLELIDGALVLVHSDLGNGLDFPLFQSDTTRSDGTVALGTADAPSVAAIVTVVRAGYDLFTLHGTPCTRLSVPLRRSNQPDASASGTVRTSDSGAVAFLPGLARRFDDSRRAVELPRGFPSLGCTTTAELVTCAHVNEPIRAAQLGARSFFAGNFSQSFDGFQTSLLLRAFTLVVPFQPVDVGEDQFGQLEVFALLDDPDAPAEDAASKVPEFTFQVDPASGVDLAGLTDDPETTGAPFVTVETLVPGVPGAIAAAQGLAFEQGAGTNRWTIRAAQPGAITMAGSLGADGRVDTDPFVRVEVLDVHGNAAGVRPRVSSLPADGSAVLRALHVPAQLAPAGGAQSGGEAFTLLLTHAIDRTEPGLYRAELLDSAGRGWDLWRFDSAGSADVEIRVVDVGEAGGAGLLDGDLRSTVSAFAWGPLVSTDFFWSDVEREFELFSRAAPLIFAKQ